MDAGRGLRVGPVAGQDIGLTVFQEGEGAGVEQRRWFTHLVP